jgi:hypothetical protein
LICSAVLCASARACGVFCAVERIGCTAGLPFFALRTCSDADILNHRLTVFDRFQSVGAS